MRLVLNIVRTIPDLDWAGESRKQLGEAGSVGHLEVTGTN